MYKCIIVVIHRVGGGGERGKGKRNRERERKLKCHKQGRRTDLISSVYLNELLLGFWYLILVRVPAVVGHVQV